MKRTACLLVAVAFAGLSQLALAEVYGPPAPPATEEGYSYDVGLRSELDTTRKRIENGLVSAYDKGDKVAESGSDDWSCGCGGCCGSQSCCGCGCGTSCCCDPCCRNQGLYGGAEVSWLKPHSSSGTGLHSEEVEVMKRYYNMTTTPTLIFDGTLDPDFEATYRLWVGYQRCDGLGWRIRYWEFDHGTAGAVSGAVIPDYVSVTTEHAWNTYVFDFETTDATRLGCNWDALLSIGFRYVDYREERNLRITQMNPGELFVSQSKRFNGIGTTGALELRRAVSCNLNAFVIGRTSVLMGDEDNHLHFEDPSESVTITLGQLNDVKFIYELQAGAELVRRFCGGEYFVRGGVEMQYWDTFGLSRIDPLGDDSIGFGGFFISAGVQR